MLSNLSICHSIKITQEHQEQVCFMKAWWKLDEEFKQKSIVRFSSLLISFFYVWNQIGVEPTEEKEGPRWSTYCSMTQVSVQHRNWALQWWIRGAGRPEFKTSGLAPGRDRYFSFILLYTALHWLCQESSLQSRGGFRLRHLRLVTSQIAVNHWKS